MLAAAALVGCSPGADRELRYLVEDAEPAAGRSLGCEWGREWGTDAAGTYYGCWREVSGTLADVAGTMQARLTERGYAVAPEEAPLQISLTATRGTDTMCVDVLAPGFTQGRNTLASDLDIPPGRLLVDLWISRGGDSSVPPCAALPR